jgi:hypothetical protein
LTANSSLFIDVNSLGHACVLTNAAMLVCGFLAVALLTVAGDRVISEKWIGKKGTGRDRSSVRPELE